MKSPFDLTGKVAIVTGGSQGIGEGIALGLARAGADVVVAARTAESVAAVAAKVHVLGRRALGIPTDVTNESGVNNLVRRQSVFLAVSTFSSTMPERRRAPASAGPQSSK